jgi:hypothetical protein
MIEPARAWAAIAVVQGGITKLKLDAIVNEHASAAGEAGPA